LDSLPLLVRPGSVIAIGADDSRPDYAYTDGVTLRITRPADGRSVQTMVPDLDGSPAATYTTTRSGTQLGVSVSGLAHDWSILLVGSDEAVSVEGGTGLSPPEDFRIAAHADTVTVQLATGWL